MDNIAKENRKKRHYSEAHRQKHVRKQAKKDGARGRRWFLLHPELAPEGWQLNWKRLSIARQVRLVGE